jgi:hypothetical protein
MAQAPESVFADAEQVCFEPERFELTGGDRPGAGAAARELTD